MEEMKEAACGLCVLYTYMIRAMKPAIAFSGAGRGMRGRDCGGEPHQIQWNVIMNLPYTINVC
jgi:hypothetical protein